MHNDIERVLFSEEALAGKAKELGKIITEDYAGEELTVIGVLKGSNVFTADLIRHIELPVILDFIAVSSYGRSTVSTGTVRLIKDLDFSIENKNILIVEDIVDTGLTLKYLMDNFQSRNPRSIRICSLLDKPERRKADIKIDYKGFDIPDEFVIGYGIDYAEKYRNLPYIGILKRSVYE